MLPGLVWARLIFLREWWGDPKQELRGDPDIEPGPWAGGVGGYGRPDPLLGGQPLPWSHCHPRRVGHWCSWPWSVGPGCGCMVPALLWPGSCTALGTGVCSAAGLQVLPCCSPASKYFLLSADYQLIGSTLEVSFLTLPEFILIRAVAVFFVCFFFFKLSPALVVGTWWELV